MQRKDRGPAHAAKGGQVGTRSGRDRGPKWECAFISGAELWGGRSAVEDRLTSGAQSAFPGTFVRAEGAIPLPLCGPRPWSVAPGLAVLKSEAPGLCCPFLLALRLTPGASSTGFQGREDRHGVGMLGFRDVADRG